MRPEVVPGQVRAGLPDLLPEHPQPLETLLGTLDGVVAPATLHWQHPAFFGYFPANAALASLLGDLLSGGLGGQGMLWSTAPAGTEMEQALLDGLASAIGLGPEFTVAGGGGGTIADSASSAALVALLAALHRTSDGRWREEGVDGRECVYVTRRDALVGGQGGARGRARQPRAARRRPPRRARSRCRPTRSPRS